MSKRLSFIIIAGLLCFNILNDYLWSKKIEILDKGMTVLIQSNDNRIGTIYDRLNDLCSRLSSLEKSAVKQSSSGTPFKIVDDKG